MKKRMKRKITKFVTVILIAAALIFIPSIVAGSRKNQAAATVSSSHVFTVRTEAAEIRTLQAYIEVNANIVSGHQVVVMPEASGRLASMRVGLGTAVQRGELLAEIDPSRPGAVFSMSPVRAPVSGRVVTVPQTVGSMVSTATPLMTLAVDGSIEIDALIPEREVGQLRTGLSAEVRLEAFPGETFSAVLTQLSPVVDPVSRTKRITLRFDQPDPRINPGMFARIKLNTRTYENVVSVPQEALVEQRGRTVVYVLYTAQQDEDSGREYYNGAPAGTPRVEMREVISGVIVDREAEIKSGLTPGEIVVVQGQQFLTDGAPVRVIGRRL
jgi:multidrug efflux pump subunit AcrA (membrane-fusion protein)